MTIKFTASLKDYMTIMEISHRAVAAGLYKSRIDCQMDIECTHSNGRPIRLNELRHADDPDFIHDVDGIRRHLCRETGALLNGFMPRYAVRETGEPATVDRP